MTTLSLPSTAASKADDLATQTALLVADGSCPKIRELLAEALVPVLWLEAGQPALSTVTAALAVRRRQGQPVQTLHWVSHGRPGVLLTGEAEITRGTLIQQRSELASWDIQNLALWSCRYGADATALNLWEEYTGASVCATNSALGQLDNGEQYWRISHTRTRPTEPISLPIQTPINWPHQLNGITIELTDASDTGSSSTDNVTTDTTPTFTGTGAPGSAIVYLANNDTNAILGSSTADSNGDWSITSSELSGGTYNITAKYSTNQTESLYTIGTGGANLSTAVNINFGGGAKLYSAQAPYSQYFLDLNTVSSSGTSQADTYNDLASAYNSSIGLGYNNDWGDEAGDGFEITISGASFSGTNASYVVLESRSVQPGQQPTFDSEDLVVALTSDPEGDSSASNIITTTPPTFNSSTPLTIQIIVPTPNGGGGSSGGGGDSGSVTLATPVDNTPIDPAPAGTNIQPTDDDNDGIKEVVVASDGSTVDGNRDGITDALQGEVAGLRLINDGAAGSDYGAVQVSAGTQLAAVTLISPNAETGAITMTARDGSSVVAALPTGISNSFAGAVVFNVQGVTPGGSTGATIHLPTGLVVDPSNGGYVRLNYLTNQIEEYVDAQGNPLYSFQDTDGDGTPDAIVLQLTDGDPQWDGDGEANGTIVDPGFLGSGQRNFIGTKRRDTLIGNIFANTMVGNAGRDWLQGDEGRDVLKGGRDKDRLWGGLKADLITGGKDADRILYYSAEESTAEQADTVTFGKKDRFQFRSFDGNSITEGQQSLRYIGQKAFSGAAGELRFTGNGLQADTTGDAQADFVVNFARSTPWFSEANILI